MQLTEIKIHLCPSDAGRLKAFCSVTLDNEFVIRDLKLIEGDTGLFLAMPSRKLCDHCPRCREKNHLRARFCNHCGSRLNENRHQRYRLGPDRLKLHADIAHPVNARTRAKFEQEIIIAFEEEVIKSKQPGYVPTPMETEISELTVSFNTGAA